MLLIQDRPATLPPLIENTLRVPESARQALEARGYTLTAGIRKSYRGALLKKTVITADAAEVAALVIETLGDDDHYRRLQSIQHNLPFVPPIIDVVDGYAVIQRVEGSLLWEMERDRPDPARVAPVLKGFVAGLRTQSLVHGDIRPWNVIYHKASTKFFLIDWEFSFFLDQPERYAQAHSHLAECGHAGRDRAAIDQEDLRRFLDVYAGRQSLAAAWNYDPDLFAWNPAWCAG